MPTYQYACKHCDHRFDVRQRFTDDPLTTCPECGGAIQRVINPVGIIFKGSGFYVTDNKNGNKSYTNGNGKKAKNGTGKSGAEKSASEKTTTAEKSSSKTD